MTECYKLHVPRLEMRVYERLLLLDKKYNKNRIKKRIIPFPTIRKFICPPYSLKRKDLKTILYYLARLGLIKVIKKHGVMLND